jgi:hypothetical protein
MGFAGPPDPNQCSDDISAAPENHRSATHMVLMLSDPRDNLSERRADDSCKMVNSHLDIATLKSANGLSGDWKSRTQSQISWPQYENVSAPPHIPPVKPSAFDRASSTYGGSSKERGRVIRSGCGVVITITDVLWEVQRNFVSGPKEFKVKFLKAIKTFNGRAAGKHHLPLTHHYSQSSRPGNANGVSSRPLT